MKAATFFREPRQILYHIGTNNIEAASLKAVTENLDTLLYEIRIRLKTTHSQWALKRYLNVFVTSLFYVLTLVLNVYLTFEKRFRTTFGRFI